MTTQIVSQNSNSENICSLVAKKANELNPFICEGYVLCDEDFFRISVKCSAFVVAYYVGANLNLMMNGIIVQQEDYINEKVLLDLIRLNQVEEVVSYLFQFRNMKQELQRKFKEFIQRVVETFEKFKDLPPSKFSLAIDSFSFKHLLKKARFDKIPIQQTLMNWDIDDLQKLIQKMT